MGLLKLVCKVSVLLVFISNGLLQAQEKIESQASTKGCPQDFYTLPLYPNAKFCQLFAGELPASISYFVISNQQTAKAFYLKQLGQAEDEKMLKGRIILQYDNAQKVVVISKDGQGSQIDILIKSTG
ncbi:MAG: hypothetical protein ACI9UT_002356 [Flavobacteriales bacterium]|jgi:hypothetical protein